jgi:hypothetical protein
MKAALAAEFPLPSPLPEEDLAASPDFFSPEAVLFSAESVLREDSPPVLEEDLAWGLAEGFGELCGEACGEALGEALGEA